MHEVPLCEYQSILYAVLRAATATIMRRESSHERQRDHTIIIIRLGQIELPPRIRSYMRWRTGRHVFPGFLLCGRSCRLFRGASSLIDPVTSATRTGAGGDGEQQHRPPRFEIGERREKLRKAPSRIARSGAGLRLQLERRSLMEAYHGAGRWPKFSPVEF
jgi:hypothetical protein